jgi:hypothetical protein
MIEQRSLVGSNNTEDAEGSSQILDALRTHAMDDLHAAALECGITLKNLAVIDRQFKGESPRYLPMTCYLPCLRRDCGHNGQTD